MKKLFYLGATALVLFEILNVYFIMPMPGSQRMHTIDVAYFLYSYRWYFRILFGLMILVGLFNAFQAKNKRIPVLVILLIGAVIYMFNFRMSADAMFKQPGSLTFESKDKFSLTDSTVVIGVANNGETKAYPIRYIVYHHQVQDMIGGKPMIITYCSVCRTGRVYEPLVKGKPEKFRLVGMDHFNAMFEDATTKSWWRQVNGEAVTGLLKGEMLPEVESFQVTVKKLFELYPNAMVMQLDKNSKAKYDTLGKFERGKSKGDLTRTDSLSWKDKSWVVGIQISNQSKAYDWNLLKEQRIINDQVGGKLIVIALSKDEQSFVAFERPDETNFSISNDSLFVKNQSYTFSGSSTSSLNPLKKINAYQEFWHSWRTFHPTTLQYAR